MLHETVTFTVEDYEKILLRDEQQTEIIKAYGELIKGYEKLIKDNEERIERLTKLCKNTIDEYEKLIKDYENLWWRRIV